ncbi:MAG: PAS domain S-box protein [Deltaproteobacteria bacterium]|nr:PAS domain S-box protein [Deltaproteobacteria bacterium]
MHKASLRAVFTYLGIGTLWILLSDEITKRFFDSSPQVQLLKGWLFVCATAGLLYWLIQKYTRRAVEEAGAALSQGTAGPDKADVASRELERARAAHDYAAERLAQSTRELQDIKYALDQSTILAITDRRGLITFVNDQFCTISKYSRDELVGKDHRIINSGHHSREFIADLWSTILSGRVWHGEIKNRAKDGSFYWVDTTIVPFMDGSGHPYQFVAIRQDITQRKQAQDRLREQESLARLGEMAAVVAHEVKNPLAGISGAIQIIGSRLDPDSRERKIVGEIIARIEALNGRVHDMLTFARPRSPVLAPVPVPELVQETVRLVTKDPVFGKVSMTTALADLKVKADAELAREALLNLLLNAAQAMPQGGSIDIRCEPASDICRLHITDNGPGIPPELASRVFEPFITTKHKGTGLGLAIARRTIREQGGDIECQTRPGQGTTFILTLPVV